MSYKEGCGRRRLLWLQSAEREARERQTATVHENQLALATRKQELNAREKEHERQKGECTAMRANLKEAARTLEAVRWQTSNVQDLTGSDQ